MRLLALVFLAIAAAMLDRLAGYPQAEAQARRIAADGGDWTAVRYALPGGLAEIPPKTPGTKRILYVSNSHARTGGYTARQLQRLLDIVEPNTFEVLDLADPGIFAPDMLQRVLQNLDADLDAIVLTVAYISFSDPMRLERQAHSVRAFFKPEIFARLSPAFWARHYDINLFANTLAAEYLYTYRYRSAIRDTWERPVSRWLGSLTGSRHIAFLDVDENQRWRFPAGYDNNLFQWSLYAAGRSSHLADLQELIAACRENGIPLVMANLPIDFGKSVYRPDEQDFASFRRSLHELGAGADLYIDYQDIFPSAFSTYDALHPTWHGARLHALDLAMRLGELGLVNNNALRDELLAAMEANARSDGEAYDAALEAEHGPLDRVPFRRFDLFEPANAETLLRILATLPPGSSQEADFLFQLALRLRYWGENEPAAGKPFDGERSEVWETAFRREAAEAKNRVQRFAEALKAMQAARLTGFPLPSLASLTEVSRQSVGLAEGVTGEQVQYSGPNGLQVVEIRFPPERPIWYWVANPAADTTYSRGDVLHDGSFLLLGPGGQLVLPPAISVGADFRRWGI